jgi:hypothetical protein
MKFSTPAHSTPNSLGCIFNLLFIVVFLLFSAISVSGLVSDFSPKDLHDFEVNTEPKAENLQLPAPAHWANIVIEEVTLEATSRIQNILPSLTLTISKLDELPLPSNVATAAFGFTFSKLTKFFYKTTVTTIPPAFLAFEALAQIGYIGETDEGIVQWFRALEFSSLIGDRLDYYKLPSADNVRPFVKLAVDFFFGRALVFFLAFSVAFLF